MIRLGVIGCGHIGIRHVRAAASSLRFQVVALCDSNHDQVVAAARGLSKLEISTSRYSDLAESGLEAVAVCTPHHLHPEIVAFFVRRGIHVLVEKPLALSASAGADIARLERESRASVFVVMQRRFLPHLSAVRACYRDGFLGDLLHAESSFYWSRDSSYYSGSPWRGRLRSEGGVLYTIGCHFIDSLGYATEFPGDCIACSTRRLRHAHEIDDSGSAIFTMTNGSLFSLNWSTCACPQGQLGTLTLIFERCTIALGGRFLEEFELLGDEGGTARRAFQSIMGAESAGDFGSGDLHGALYEVLGDRLLTGTGDDRLCTPADATRGVDLIERAYARAGAVAAISPLGRTTKGWSSQHAIEKAEESANQAGIVVRSATQAYDDLPDL